MRKWLRRLLILLLAIIFIVSMVRVIQQRRDYQKGQSDYSEALETAGIQHADVPAPEMEGEPDRDPYAAELAKMDLAGLREVNREVIGWISIPNTEISYPLLRTEDNDYYLNRTWKKDWSSVGSIFMDCRVSPDFSDFNTIIYGHRMRNGSMFGGLKYYGDSSYWQEHPSVYIVNDEGVHRYDIFAAYEAGTSAISDGLGISEDAEKQEFIQYSLECSAIDTGIIPTKQDHILTLVTCTGRGYATRWVVQAVLREELLTEGV